MQRLLSIDCLRGLAALGVVLHHASLQNPAGLGPGHPVTVVEEVLGLGFAGVWLFFVISGFCIHLSQARAPKRRPRGRSSRSTSPASGKADRQALPGLPGLPRALPPLNVMSGAMKVDESLVSNFVLHLLMLHNFDPTAAYGFCGSSARWRWKNSFTWPTSSCLRCAIAWGGRGRCSSASGPAWRPTRSISWAIGGSGSSCRSRR